MSSSCDRLLDKVHLLTHELHVVVEVVVLIVEARLYASELGVHVVELVVHVVELVGDGLLCIPMVTPCDGFLFILKGWFLSSICSTVPRHDSHNKYGYSVIWWVDTTTLSHLSESIGLMIRAKDNRKANTHNSHKALRWIG